MIGRLRGVLLFKEPPALLLEVGGVAYELDAPLFTFYRLPDVGQEVVLHTHLVVREDAQLLYGFFQLRERNLFRSLLKVRAVGPKLALAILSGIEPDEFVTCVMQNNGDRLARIPGLGKKTAERLVIEMRDRLVDWQQDYSTSTNSCLEIPLSSAAKATQEATSALVSLGYKLAEARRAVAQVPAGQYSSEQLIRQALRTMMKVEN